MSSAESRHVTVSVAKAAQRDYEENGAAHYGHRSWSFLDPRVQQVYIAMACRRLERLAG